MLNVVSDRVGRKPVLVAGLLLQPLMGSLVAVVPTFPLFVLFRYLTGFALGNTMVISFVLGKYSYVCVLTHNTIGLGLECNAGAIPAGEKTFGELFKSSSIQGG